MRLSDIALPDPDFPGRYILDEARFIGGRDRIRAAYSHSSPEETNT